MKTYNIEFEGYFISKDNLPVYGGIYAVYTGRYDVNTDKVYLRELIYVGEAENIYKRHHQHEKQEAFESELCNGEILIYATCNHPTDRVRIQDTIIYNVKPELNTIGVNEFNHPLTILQISGDSEYIPEHIRCE